MACHRRSIKIIDHMRQKVEVRLIDRDWSIFIKSIDSLRFWSKHRFLSKPPHKFDQLPRSGGVKKRGPTNFGYFLRTNNFRFWEFWPFFVTLSTNPRKILCKNVSGHLYFFEPYSSIRFKTTVKCILSRYCLDMVGGPPPSSKDEFGSKTTLTGPKVLHSFHQEFSKVDLQTTLEGSKSIKSWPSDLQKLVFRPVQTIRASSLRRSINDQAMISWSMISLTFISTFWRIWSIIFMDLLWHP